MWKYENEKAVTFVEVPEEEELTPARSRTADMAKQIDTWVPEHPVKTQHHLSAERSTRAGDRARGTRL